MEKRKILALFFLNKIFNGTYFKLVNEFLLQTLEIITQFCLLFSGSKNPASTTGNPMHASMSRSQPGGGSSQPGQPQHLQQPHQQGQHHGQQQRLQNNQQQQQRNMSLPHMQQQQQKSSRSSQQQHRHSSSRNSYYILPKR